MESASSFTTQNQQMTEEKNEGKNGSSFIEMCPSNAVPSMNLEGIEICIMEDVSTLEDPKARQGEISSNSNDNTKEMEGRFTCPAKNAFDQGMMKNAAQRRRKIGVVEVSDTMFAERRNVRVLRKKFGESMISEMPRIFNKKL